MVRSDLIDLAASWADETSADTNSAIAVAHALGARNDRS